MKSEKMLSFEKAVTPLLEWMKENCTPHDRVIADVMGAELLNGEVVIPSEYNKMINKLVCEANETK